jgi:O-antigen ligase
MAALLISRRKAGRVRLLVPKRVLAAFVSYMVIALLSTCFGVSPKLGLFQLSACLQAFLLFVFLLSYLTTPRRIKLFVAGLLVGVAIQSGITILQARHPGHFRYAFLGAQEEEEHRMYRGNLTLPDVDLGTTYIGGDIQERPTGFLIHPNVLALYLALSIPLVVVVCFVSKRRYYVVCAAAIAIAAGTAMYYSLSRSGWFALLFALAVLAALWLKWKPMPLMKWHKGVIAVFVLAGLAGGAWNAKRIYQRMTETADDAVYFRRNLNTAAAKMALSHPLFGVGLNSFVQVVQKFDASRMSDVKQYPAHNIALLETAETGLLGGLSFVAMWIAVFHTMWRLLPITDGATLPRAIMLASFAGLAGFFLGDMSNFAYRIPVMTSTVWAQAAVGIAAGRLAALTGRESIDV